MLRTVLACLALPLTVGCDNMPARGTDPLTEGNQELSVVRMNPPTSDLRIGDRVVFSATFPGSSPQWTWSVTDTVVARIHPDSGSLLALHAGITNVIATYKERPAIRGVAPVQVR